MIFIFGLAMYITGQKLCPNPYNMEVAAWRRWSGTLLVVIGGVSMIGSLLLAAWRYLP